MLWIRLLYCTTAILFLVLSSVTVNLSSAAFSAHYIESRLAAWRSIGYLRDDREWQSVYDANQHLYTQFPLNPRHLHSRTRLLEWQIFQQRLYPDYANKSSREALEGYREWTHIAPSQGYPWASIAELQANLGIFDETTINALKNAFLLGPIEDLTQRRVIRTGLKHWRNLPQNSKDLVKATIDNALQTDTTLQRYPITSFVYDTAIRQHWEEELQQFLTDDQRVTQYERRKRFFESQSRIN